MAAFLRRHAFKLPSICRSYSKLKIDPQNVPNMLGLVTKQGVYECNLQLKSLGQLGRLSEARKVFDEMLHKDVVSYSSMVTIYLKHNDLHRAEILYNAMPERNVVADSAMVHAFAKIGRLDFARKIFDHMPHRNVFSWTGLISGYLQHGRVEEACRLFTQMPEKNEVSWTTMLLGLARNGLIDQARETFDQIPAQNVVSWTAMIRAYVENSRVDDALQLFYQMPVRNLYSWNIMIQGCLNCNRVDEAVRLFNSMGQRNAVSWTTMVTGLAQKGWIDLARKYFDQMANKDVAAWNAMITAYADEGLMVEALELFNTMPDQNTVTWNAMIDGYAKNGPQQQALTLFILMLRSRHRVNVITFTSVLIACQGVLELSQAHALVIQLGFESETSLINALITMYSKMGDLNSARFAFKNVETKDVFSWTAMILAYSNYGYGIQALTTFGQMLRSGNQPDVITFLGILSACSHSGLVKKGRKLFTSMKAAYNITPNKEHLCCLVDILGRAGLIGEAAEVMGQMGPGDRDGAVVGSLLGSCKLHGGQAELVDVLGERLLELEPCSSGSYVLLCNLYAGNGQWDEYAKMRKRMKESRVNKIPGYSQVELKGKNHVFYAGDKSHSEIQHICSLLQEKLLPVMLDQYNCINDSVFDRPHFLFGK